MTRGFCYSGPDNSQDVWHNHRSSAEGFFRDCGLNVESAFSKCDSIARISAPEFTFYYALAHGTPHEFLCSDNQKCRAKQIAAYFGRRASIGFAFLGHCHAMVDSGPGSFSHVFRKGELRETVTIGYHKAEESEGWRFSLPWQKHLFSYLKQGMTFGDAFEEANADYPEVEEFVRLVGDRELTVSQATLIKDVQQGENEAGSLDWLGRLLRLLLSLLVRRFTRP